MSVTIKLYKNIGENELVDKSTTAVDVRPCRYTYTETDEPIEPEEPQEVQNG